MPLTHPKAQSLNEMADIHDNQIVITGGEGDLGQAICVEFKPKPYKINAPGRSELDVTCPKAVRNYFSQLNTDLLVCNAGITRDQPLIKLSELDWDAVWDTNYAGALRCAEAALPMMLEQGSGHIIFISSYSATHPPIGQSAYAAAKASLLGLTKDFASRHGSNNIRINAIMPGFLETKMTNQVSDNRIEEVKNLHALGRFNTCKEVAKFIRFLHEEMPHTSGQVFNLDSRMV